MKHTGRILYALACIIVPMLWGLVVLWASNRLESCLRRQGKEPPTIEYHI